MSQALYIQGWRQEEINRIYDIAANMDGYYFDDSLPPSRQKNYQREHFQKRMLTGREANRARVKDAMKSETGRNNQVTVMNAIERIKTGRAPHPQANILSEEVFDKCRAKLVQMGKLSDLVKSGITGKDYIYWVTHTLPEYEKGQPRFGANHAYKRFSAAVA